MTASATSSADAPTPAATPDGQRADTGANAAQAYPQSHHWTREEYYAVADTGIFANRRVELIDGTIVDMSPHKARHAGVISLAQRALIRALGEDANIRIQLPLTISKDNEPEPDVAWVAASIQDCLSDHPATARLVVEIADTSLAFDRGHKAHLYALAGVEDYWVVNLNDNNVDVFRSPTPDPAAPFGHRYAERRTLRKGDTIAPLAKADATIAIADLLP